MRRTPCAARPGARSLLKNRRRGLRAQARDGTGQQACAATAPLPGRTPAANRRLPATDGHSKHGDRLGPLLQVERQNQGSRGHRTCGAQPARSAHPIQAALGPAAHHGRGYPNLARIPSWARTMSASRPEDGPLSHACYPRVYFITDPSPCLRNSDGIERRPKTTSADAELHREARCGGGMGPECEAPGGSAHRPDRPRAWTRRRGTLRLVP